MPPKSNIDPRRLPELIQNFQAAVAGGSFNSSAAFNLVRSMGVEPQHSANPLVLSKLHIAISQQNIVAVRAAIDLGEDINALVGDITPLMLAVIYKNIEIVQLLLEQPNINIDSVDDCNINIWHLAAMADFSEIFDLLLNPQYKNLLIHFNDQDIDGFTSLHVAVRSGHIGLVRTLLKYPHININTIAPHSPLHEAVLGVNLDILAELLGHASIIVDIPDNAGATPLFYAVMYAKIQAAEMLYKAGANIHHKTHENYSLLHAAAASGHLDLIDFVLKLPGFHVDDKDALGHTALHFALLHGNAAVVDLLIKSGKTDLNTPANTGMTPFMIAVNNNNLTVIKQCLEHPEKIMINISNNKGYTALHLAADKGFIEVVRELLSHLTEMKLNLGAKNIDGKTALELAATGHHIGVVQLLLPYCEMDDITVLHNIVDNPNIDKQIYQISKEKLLELQVIQKKFQGNVGTDVALSADALPEHEKLPEISKCWQELKLGQYYSISNMIGVSSKAAMSASDLMMKATQFVRDSKESYKLPHILLFAVALSVKKEPTADILFDRVLAKMEKAQIHYQEYKDAVNQIIKLISINTHVPKECVTKLKKIDFSSHEDEVVQPAKSDCIPGPADISSVAVEPQEGSSAKQEDAQMSTTQEQNFPAALRALLPEVPENASFEQDLWPALRKITALEKHDGKFELSKDMRKLGEYAQRIWDEKKLIEYPYALLIFAYLRHFCDNYDGLSNEIYDSLQDHNAPQLSPVHVKNVEYAIQSYEWQLHRPKYSEITAEDWQDLYEDLANRLKTVQYKMQNGVEEEEITDVPIKDFIDMHLDPVFTSNSLDQLNQSIEVSKRLYETFEIGTDKYFFNGKKLFFLMKDSCDQLEMWFCKAEHFINEFNEEAKFVGDADEYFGALNI